MISDYLYDRPQIIPGQSDSLSLLVQHLPDTGTLLDVGCATGLLGQYLQEHTQLIVDGIEANPESAQLAQPFYRSLYRIDIEADDFASALPQTYDVIVLADILEHLRAPEQAVRTLLKKLTPSGKLLISVPNVGHQAVIYQLLSQNFHYLDHGLLDKTHLRFFSAQNLSCFFEDVGSVRWKMLGRVIKAMQNSEFSNTIDTIPPAAKQLLNHLPEGNTYQFLIEARPEPDTQNAINETPSDQRSPEQPGLLINPTVFYLHADQTTYSPDQQIEKDAYLDGSPIELSFQLPHDTERLRFDPANLPGIIKVNHLHLTDSSGEILWQMGPQTTFTHHSANLHCKITEEGQLSLWMRDNDSWFELPVEASVLNQATALHVSMHWDDSPEFMLLQKTCQSDHQHLSHELMQKRAHNQDLQQALETLTEAYKTQIQHIKQLESEQQTLQKNLEERESEKQALQKNLELERNQCKLCRQSKSFIKRLLIKLKLIQNA